VVQQTPGAGTIVDRGTNVAIQISRGPQKVTVPDVTGFATNAARSQLTGLGFKVKVVTQQSKAQPDTVFKQTPAGGTDAIKGSTVTIFVAQAPKATGGPGGTTTPGTTTPAPTPPSTTPNGTGH
jgi:serine/threonine-protein kinase